MTDGTMRGCRQVHPFYKQALESKYKEGRKPQSCDFSIIYMISTACFIQLQVFLAISFDEGSGNQGYQGNGQQLKDCFPGEERIQGG